MSNKKNAYLLKYNRRKLNMLTNTSLWKAIKKGLIENHRYNESTIKIMKKIKEMSFNENNDQTNTPDSK